MSALLKPLTPSTKGGKSPSAQLDSQKFNEYCNKLKAIRPINSEAKAQQYRNLFDEYHGTKLSELLGKNNY